MWIFLLKVADFMVTENIEAMQKKSYLNRSMVIHTTIRSLATRKAFHVGFRIYLYMYNAYENRIIRNKHVLSL